MTTNLTPAQLFAEFLPTDWVYIPNLDGHIGWAYESGVGHPFGTLTICYKPAIDHLATEPRHPEATFEFAAVDLWPTPPTDPGPAVASRPCVSEHAMDATVARARTELAAAEAREHERLTEVTRASIEAAGARLAWRQMIARASSEDAEARKRIIGPDFLLLGEYPELGEVLDAEPPEGFDLAPEWFTFDADDVRSRQFRQFAAEADDPDATVTHSAVDATSVDFPPVVAEEGGVTRSAQFRQFLASQRDTAETTFGPMRHHKNDTGTTRLMALLWVFSILTTGIIWSIIIVLNHVSTLGSLAGSLALGSTIAAGFIWADR